MTISSLSRITHVPAYLTAGFEDFAVNTLVISRKRFQYVTFIFKLRHNVSRKRALMEYNFLPCNSYL